MKTYKELPYSFWGNPKKVFETMQKMENAQQILKLEKFKADLKYFKEYYMSPDDRKRFEEKMACLRKTVSVKVESKPQKPEEVRIFIGHGHNPQWRDLKDYLQDKLHFEVHAFETEARAGFTIKEVLDEMTEIASFALLVHTGEDENKYGKLHARENVIHETGLFQGKLGFRRAIVLLEDQCNEFSNIHGLQQIRFSKGNIKETFGEVLATIYREFGLSQR